MHRIPPSFGSFIFPPMDRKHKFWSTQPVEVSGESGVIERPKMVSKDPPVLPEGFSFSSDVDMAELASFLAQNYVEDVDGTHVLCYPPRFLSWMINNPRHSPEYTLVVRWNGEVVGFAFAKEHVLSVQGKRERVVSVNLLCISRSLRGRRLAPIIIGEITRRSNLNGIHQAIFTSGTELFFNIAAAHYYHRPIDPIKLYKTGFCTRIACPGMLEPRPGTRPMTGNDAAKVLQLFSEKAAAYALHVEMDAEDVLYHFMPRDGVVYTYVHEAGDEVVEFGTFFILETVEKRSGARIRAAYLYYTGGGSPEMIVSDLICFAKEQRCDVFTCLDIMDNHVFLDSLGFSKGTGFLRYYLYNWRAPSLSSREVSFVMY
jgi:glycylpeptide N-tetradecanoyltransferase